MATRAILTYPDDRLRLTSQPVMDFDSNLASMVDDLLETFYRTSAIALSAPQIDDRREVLVIDLSEARNEPQVYINPEIRAKGAWGLIQENCLSLPGLTGNVVRCTQVSVRAQDVKGQFFDRDLAGMNAVCLQHEMDHFAGKLFIDKLSIFRRLYIKATYDPDRAKAAEEAGAA